MANSASWALGPPKDSSRTLFLKSQFCTSARRPPKDTNLEGKVAIVTGSTGGLGLEASRQLLSFGLSTLIMAVRSAQKGEAVASKFRAEFPDASINVWSLEMESYDSIQAFARRSGAELDRLDIAILNAAMQTADFTLIPSTGHEKYIQVNYLSTVLLAILLLPILKAKSPSGTPGRLTIVSSGTARGARIALPKEASVLPTLDDKSNWHAVRRYAESKLLGHLFILNLARYVDADDVIVNLVDPGLVKGTNLQGFAPPLVAAFFYVFKGIFGRTVELGASTYVDAAAIKGKESHGCYVADWEISPFAEFIYTAEGEEVRDRLWRETMAEFEFTDAQGILDGLKK